MHQALAGLLQSKLRAVILASHSSPLAHDAPSPPSTSGRCSGITMENSNGKDSLSLAVLTPTSTPPKGTDHSRGGGKMFHFFLFFFLILPMPAPGCWEWEKVGRLWGGHLRARNIHLGNTTARNSAPSSPHSHTISVPGSHSGAWDSRKRFCNSIFLLALVKGW